MTTIRESIKNILNKHGFKVESNGFILDSEDETECVNLSNFFNFVLIAFLVESILPVTLNYCEIKKDGQSFNGLVKIVEKQLSPSPKPILAADTRFTCLLSTE